MCFSIVNWIIFALFFGKKKLPNLYKQTNKGTRALPYALAGNKQTNNFCELFVNVNKIFGSSRMSCGGKWSSLEHLLGSVVRKRVFRGFCGWVSKGWGGGGFPGAKISSKWEKLPNLFTTWAKDDDENSTRKNTWQTQCFAIIKTAWNLLIYLFYAKKLIKRNEIYEMWRCWTCISIK